MTFPFYKKCYLNVTNLIKDEINKNYNKKL